MLLPGTTQQHNPRLAQVFFVDCGSEKLRAGKDMTKSLWSSLQNLLTCGARSQRKSFRSTYNGQFHDSVRRRSCTRERETESFDQAMANLPPPPYEFKDSLPVRETSGTAEAEAQIDSRAGEGRQLLGNKNCRDTDGDGE